MSATGGPTSSIYVPYNGYNGARPTFQFFYWNQTFVIEWVGGQWNLRTLAGLVLYNSNINTDCPVSTLSDWNQVAPAFTLLQFDIVESSLPYECGINYTYKNKDGIFTGLLYPVGTRNELPTYVFDVAPSTFEISYDGAGTWVFTPLGIYVTILYENTSGLPDGFWTKIGLVGNSFETAIESCAVAGTCDCGISWGVEVDEVGETWIWNNVGEINGQFAYQYTLDGQLLSMWYDGEYNWFVTEGDILLEEAGDTLTTMYQPVGICCPINQDINGNYNWADFTYNHGQFYDVQSSVGVSCGCRNEDRIFKEYNSIKLPISFAEENRGIKDCCCKELVLAGGKNSWSNDVTSAWIKLSDIGDSCSIEVYKEGNVLANWQPALVEFVNEPNAFYATVPWKAILDNDGPGCYKIVINYLISGIGSSFEWGEYDLKEYTVNWALHTARISAVFDGYHEMEGIDFSGSQVPSTLRFYGFIGFRQPNFEIDNVIYGDRQMKRNMRENLNVYEIITDPVDECITKQMIELYLLSENELFISDYNAHNHSYRYQDLAVIVEDSPSLDYPDPFSRKAVVKCKVGDKFKNKRTYY
jgi:hypothetical protein